MFISQASIDAQRRDAVPNVGDLAPNAGVGATNESLMSALKRLMHRMWLIDTHASDADFKKKGDNGNDIDDDIYNDDNANNNNNNNNEAIDDVDTILAAQAAASSGTRARPTVLSAGNACLELLAVFSCLSCDRVAKVLLFCLFIDAFVAVVWRVMPKFGGYRQHDAHEFLRYLLDRIDIEMRHVT